MSDKLLTCPFCGEEYQLEVVFKDLRHNTRWEVQCLTCGASIWDISKSKAIRLWNCRTKEVSFTKKEAEKIETFLIHGYQMLISKNKKIYSKLEKMKGANNE